MIAQKLTRLFRTEHFPVQEGVVIQEEGMALVFVQEGGKTVVKPSTGAAGEVFAGLSQSRNSPPSFIPHVFESVIPASLVVELPRIPMAGQILVKVGGTKLTVVADAPASASEVQLTVDKLIFFAGEAAKSLYVQYIYEPSLAEARTVLGDMPIGGLPSTYQGIIGVTLHGTVGTTMYDASKDWSGVINPRLGVDGRLTTDGPGTLLTNVQVIQTPVSEPGNYGALVVRVSA